MFLPASEVKETTRLNARNKQYKIELENIKNKLRSLISSKIRHAAKNGDFRIWVKLNKLEHYQHQEAFAFVTQELKDLGYNVEIRNPAPEESICATLEDLTQLFLRVSWEE